MEEFVAFFKALSDRTRLRIIWLLNEANACLCVCEIMDSLNENQYNVSRHLKTLKHAGFLNEEKEGRWVYYSLARPGNRFQELLIETVSAIPKELFAEEAERLTRRLALRENGKCVSGMRSEEWYELS